MCVYYVVIKIIISSRVSYIDLGKGDPPTPLESGLDLKVLRRQFKNTLITLQINVPIPLLKNTQNLIKCYAT